MGKDYTANPLAKARKAAGLTQKQLAESTKIPMTLICKLENGTRDMLKLNVDYAMRIASALGMTVEQLFGEPGSEKSSYFNPLPPCGGRQ